MPNTRVFKPSFSGGEISPEMFGRIDDAKYGNGAALLQNLVATALGPCEKRPGFEFVAPTKGNGIARLIPFTYSTSQTMVLEIGEHYFRFHTLGETLLYTTPQRAWFHQGAAAFTVASPTVVSQTAHNLITGDQVIFTSTGGVTYPFPVDPNAQYFVTVIDADHYNISLTSGGPFVNVSVAASGGTIYGSKVWMPGELCSSGGTVYYCYAPFHEAATVPADPSTVPSSFYLEPSNLTYEVPNSYAAADIFDIHYVQSNDVVTLVHPSYPPSELKRLGATEWTFLAIDFSALLPPPANASVTPHPGFKAKIMLIDGLTPSKITTETNHTLAMGDPVYVQDLGPTFDGFYIVDKVPLDTTGALIPNELYLVDLNGNMFHHATTFTGGPTIQYGSQIFNITNFYAVTAIATDSIQESAISNEASALNNLNVTGSYNTITWNAVPNAFRYYIYKKLNGLYGYIGEVPAGTLTFSDNNIAPDFSITPPTYDPVFQAPLDYPDAVTYFQQRRAFAGTNEKPQNLWMSKTGTESDFSYSLPIKDTDRIAIGVAARQSSTIRHLVPLNQLMLMTDQSEISVSPQNTDTITPSTIAARPQSYIGSSNVQPTVVNNSLVFAANRGGHVREMGYRWELGGYLTGDISLRAAHLFDNLTIVDQTFMKAPYQVVWFVSSNGNLLGLTYIPEEQIGAWHHHTTDGVFESVACVAEGVEDRLYAVIRRQVNDATVRYIERMSTRNFDQLEDCFYVDAGAIITGSNVSGTTLTATLLHAPPIWRGTWLFDATTPIFAYPAKTDVGSVIVMTGSDGNEYSFTIWDVPSAFTAMTAPVVVVPVGVTIPPSTTWSVSRPSLSGLDWLEGKTVSILSDGAVVPPQVVTGGKITLERPGNKVIVGLPFTAAAETLPLVLQIDAMGQGRQKNINKVWIKVYRSSGIFAGPSGSDLVEYRQRTLEPYGSPPGLITDEVEIVIPPSWQDSGQIYIEQLDPLPLTIVGLTIQTAAGG